MCCCKYRSDLHIISALTLLLELALYKVLSLTIRHSLILHH